MRKVKKIMGLLKGAARLAALAVLGVLAFDLAAYFLFPGLVQRVAPEYANEVGVEVWRRNREHPYYRAVESRGFDIAPGAQSIAWHPPEVAPYEIWGNSVGCFDDEPPEGRAPDIYLAGDSFTWGYTPYEAKFGTIIERETGLLIYACGVTHTGQRHQFEKFREVSGSFPGWPALVVVSVVTNDLANDFAFPHTVSVRGVLVDTTVLAEGPDGPEVVRTYPYNLAFASTDLKYYLKTYSATANIANAFIRDVLKEHALGQRDILELHPYGTYPVGEKIAAPHRRVLSEWIEHAKRNGYALRFSLIPGRNDFGSDIYAELESFLREEGGRFWDFEPYVLAENLPAKDLYWAIDGHFNPAGNAAYADFLLEMLKEEVAAGTLPPRFAELHALTVTEGAGEGQR